ncbi:MAG TPA: hypothetical protein VII42_03580, partial [Caulobacteraceae bacterium]
YGSLLDDMLFPEGSEVPTGRFINPLIEVELAFILARPLKGSGVTLFDVLAATDYVRQRLRSSISGSSPSTPRQERR